MIQAGAGNWEMMAEEDQMLIFQASANSIKINGRLAHSLKKILAENELLEEVCDKANFHSDSSKAKLCSQSSLKSALFINV